MPTLPKIPMKTVWLHPLIKPYRVGMHINESASIPAVESLNQIQQATRQFEYDEQQRQIAQTQTRGMSLS